MKGKCEMCGKVRMLSEVDVSKDWSKPKPDIETWRVCKECEEEIPEAY